MSERFLGFYRWNKAGGDWHRGRDGEPELIAYPVAQTIWENSIDVYVPVYEEAEQPWHRRWEQALVVYPEAKPTFMCENCGRLGKAKVAGNRATCYPHRDGGRPCLGAPAQVVLVFRGDVVAYGPEGHPGG